jgi:hypothetical protein
MPWRGEAARPQEPPWEARRVMQEARPRQAGAHRFGSKRGGSTLSIGAVDA